jgi:uncharacterized protein involved in response to NO
VKGAVLLSGAFRPFFIAMAGYGVIAMGLWIAVLQGAGPGTLPPNVTAWHGHEMLVGFGFAALAGFVLTAVAAWTGRPPVSGAPLLGILLAWALGRSGMLFAGVLGPQWAAVLDSLFPLLLAAALTHEVVAARNVRNWGVAAVVWWLAAANLLYHAGATGLLPLAANAEQAGLLLMLHGLALLLTLIGGRIVPAFTTNWLRRRGEVRLPRTSARLDRMTLAVTGFCGLYASILPHSSLTGLLALIAAALHTLRLSGWRGLAVLQEPLLLVLHLGYLWLPCGYLLLAAVAFGWGVAPASAVHAFAVGAIGLTMLALATRVPLGHSGLPLRASAATVAAYLLLTVAALLRVTNAWGPAYYPLLYAAASAWALALLTYLLVYTPMLLRRNKK